MSLVSRVASIRRDRERGDRQTETGTLYRAAGPTGKRAKTSRHAIDIAFTTPDLDLTTRLRVYQRALRNRV